MSTMVGRAPRRVKIEVVRRGMVVAALVAAFAVAACGGGSDFTDCALGELVGTWRVHYEETDGNCGPIADETLTSGGTYGAGCEIIVDDTSADQCRQDAEFVCPTSDGEGTLHWVVVSHHVEEDFVESTGTLEIEHSFLGTCRSTYDTTMERL